MRSSPALWIFALLLTLFSAAWQRRTVPTYPVLGVTPVGGFAATWTFERTQESPGDQLVKARAPEVSWRSGT